MVFGHNQPVHDKSKQNMCIYKSALCQGGVHVVNGLFGLVLYKVLISQSNEISARTCCFSYFWHLCCGCCIRICRYTCSLHHGLTVITWNHMKSHSAAGNDLPIQSKLVYAMILKEWPYVTKLVAGKLCR